MGPLEIPEILLFVLSFLDPKDLARCSRVSSVFYGVATDNKLWCAFVSETEIPVVVGEGKNGALFRCFSRFCRSAVDPGVCWNSLIFGHQTINVAMNRAPELLEMWGYAKRDGAACIREEHKTKWAFFEDYGRDADIEFMYHTSRIIRSQEAAGIEIPLEYLKNAHGQQKATVQMASHPDYSRDGITHLTWYHSILMALCATAKPENAGKIFAYVMESARCFILMGRLRNSVTVPKHFKTFIDVEKFFCGTKSVLEDLVEVE